MYEFSGVAALAVGPLSCSLKNTISLFTKAVNFPSSIERPDILRQSAMASMMI
jgi:hypothetical protein